MDPERRDPSVDTPAFRPNGAGEDDRAVGRMAVPPVSMPATTVNRPCGSGPDAAVIASRALESGGADVVARGMEPMIRVPPGTAPADAHDALLPPDAFHLPVGRPVTHKIYRDAAHPSRLVLPFTKRGAAEKEWPKGGCQCPVAR